MKLYHFHNNSYGDYYFVMSESKEKAHKALLQHYRDMLETRKGMLRGEIETIEEFLEDWKDINNLPRGYVIDVYYENHVIQGCTC